MTLGADAQFAQPSNDSDAKRNFILRCAIPSWELARFSTPLFCSSLG
jgi:hypothetical protein